MVDTLPGMDYDKKRKWIVYIRGKHHDKGTNTVQMDTKLCRTMQNETRHVCGSRLWFATGGGCDRRDLTGGMASARRTAAAQSEEQTQAEAQAPIERTGEGTTVTTRSIEKLVETVLGGGEVSAEEEQRLNEELPNLIQRRYAEMRHFRLQDERNESESEKQQKRLEEEMRNNMLMRIRTH